MAFTSNVEMETSSLGLFWASSGLLLGSSFCLRLRGLYPNVKMETSSLGLFWASSGLLLGSSCFFVFYTITYSLIDVTSIIFLL